MYKHLSRKEKNKYTAVYFVVLIFNIWTGLLIAPYVHTKSFFVVLEGFSNSLENPFKINICSDTFKTIVFLIVVYTTTYLIIILNLKNKRPGVEHGSAKWGDAKALSNKYANKDFYRNIIHSRGFRVSTERKKLRWQNLPNLNSIIIGGPGSGKTRGHVIPNILSAVSSFVCCDPKGTTLKQTGDHLKEKGFIIKVLDLKNPERSWGYNPFKYFRSEDDVMRTVTNLFKATTPKGSSTQDPYWDNMAQEYILGLALFLWKYAPPEEQNFPMLIDCIRHDEVLESDPNYTSDMGAIMYRIAVENKDELCVSYYNDVHNGAARTVQSIQSTAISHLAKYSLQSIRNMSEVDELDLKHIADRKTALFLLLPDDDTSFNFIPAMLYIQAFQQLYDRAEEEKNDSLPMHLHFYMDEWANIAMPDEFLQILATCRSRNIGIDIILQNLSQLKEKYKEGYENIIGQCSILKYLGGLEQSTHEYISKSLGKETIVTNSYGQSRGRNGNYTKNLQIAGRELMTPEEVRTLPNDKCIVIPQGEYAIFDEKYDMSMHPQYNQTSDITHHEYNHSRNQSVASTTITEIQKGSFELSNEEIEDDETVVVYSDEQLLEYFSAMMKEVNYNG